MAISKITLNGVTQIDLTQDTVTSGNDIRQGAVGHLRDGTTATGTLVPGVAPTLQTKSKTYTPSTSQQTDSITADVGYDGLDEVNVTVNAMASGSARPATTISSTGATLSTSSNTITLTKNVTNTPVVTAGYVASGTAGTSSVSLSATATLQGATTYYPSTTDQTINGSRYLTGNQTIKGVTYANLTAANIKNGVTVTIGDSADADRILSVTGTYSGGGGSSMNTQVAQSTSRATSSTYTELVSLTCAVAGTYDVYWSGFRSSTSGTWGSRLYINDQAYGTAQATFTNHIQNVHLTGVTIAANAEVAVRARSRGSNYYAYIGTLTIVQKS